MSSFSVSDTWAVGESRPGPLRLDGFDGNFSWDELVEVWRPGDEQNLTTVTTVLVEEPFTYVQIWDGDG